MLESTDDFGRDFIDSADIYTAKCICRLPCFHFYRITCVPWVYSETAASEETAKQFNAEFIPRVLVAHHLLTGRRGTALPAGASAGKGKAAPEAPPFTHCAPPQATPKAQNGVCGPICLGTGTLQDNILFLFGNF